MKKAIELIDKIICKERNLISHYHNRSDYVSALPHQETIRSLEEVKIILNGETLGSGNPDCPLCHGSGEYHIGGSFGGPIIVHRCRCGKLDLERT